MEIHSGCAFAAHLALCVVRGRHADAPEKPDLSGMLCLWCWQPTCGAWLCDDVQQAPSCYSHYWQPAGHGLQSHKPCRARAGSCSSQRVL